MSIETFPFNLYKANVELQLRITQMLQQGRRSCLESTQQCNAGAIAETENEIEDLLQSASWQSLATLSPETFGRLLEVGMGGAQSMNQTLIKNQTVFAAGLQQALQDWQKTVTELLNSVYSVQPLQSIFTPTRQSVEPVPRGASTKGA